MTQVERIDAPKILHKLEEKINTEKLGWRSLTIHFGGR